MAKITIENLLEQFGNDTVKEIIQNHQAANQVATGKTKREEIFSKQPGGNLQVYTPLDLEQGSPPNNGGEQFLRKIGEWGLAKGIEERAIPRIADSISANGTLLFQEYTSTGKGSGVITRAITEDKLRGLEQKIINDISRQAVIDINTAFK